MLIYLISNLDDSSMSSGVEKVRSGILHCFKVNNLVTVITISLAISAGTAAGGT
jgi:hypothetical protein